MSKRRRERIKCRIDKIRRKRVRVKVGGTRSEIGGIQL